MYILISISLNDNRTNEMVSKKKRLLEERIKSYGYYWSKKAQRYIDDKNSEFEGGSGVDYIIEECEELQQIGKEKRRKNYVNNNNFLD